jgi:NADH:ubiquinone oxidoreductase subunit 2 (subunit N)
MGALEMKNYVAVGVIVLGTVLTLAYFVRILEKMFVEGGTVTRPDASDLPWEMRFGMGTVTAGLLLFGIFSDPVISFIRTVAAPPGF